MCENVQTTTDHSSPLSTHIQLGTNWDERHKTLVELRDRKVRTALAYTFARSQFLDPLKPHHSEEHTETSSGDYCCSRFDQVQFDGVESVQQVFDVLLQCVRNVETSLSEHLRVCTVRENYDSVDDETIANFRLLSTTCGVQVETHSVMFAKLIEGHELGGDGTACGVVVFDAVDDDELYPYDSSVRVRKDVASAITLQAHKRRRSNGGGEELVVVMTSCKFVRLRRAAFELPSCTLRSIRDGLCWGTLLVKTVSEMLYPEFASPVAEDLDGRAIEELMITTDAADLDGDELKDLDEDGRAIERFDLQATDDFDLDGVVDFDFGAIGSIATTSALLNALV